MPRYLSGEDVIADARLRSQQMGRDQGVLIVEGGDDLRSLARHLLSRAAVVAAGAKWKVLDAHKRLRPGEEQAILFLVDCDYDVPCGRLRPLRNLVLTMNVDLESDMLDSDLVPHLLLELVPAVLGSDQQALEELAREVLEEAFLLAYAIGRFRLVNARDCLGLNFEALRLKRLYQDGGVDLRQLATILQQRSESEIAVDRLIDLVSEVASARNLCHGKDLLGALAIVMRSRFGVSNDELRTMPRLLRTLFDARALEKWPTVDYIRRWEIASARRLLR